MPRGQKSKLRAREKRQETHGQPQGLTGPQATAEKQEESHSSSSSSHDCLGTRRRSSDASVPQESQGVSPTGSPDAGISCSKSDVAAKGQDEKSASTSLEASIPQESRGASPTDPLKRKACALVQLLQEKFEKKESILKADMLRRVGKRYKHYFPEILNRTSERLAVAFGVELKEMDSSGESYTLVSKLGLSSEGILNDAKGLQKSGLLMSVLSVIFMKGNRATEEEVWEFLSYLGIYAGMTHPIYGDPQKLITEDLVQDKYVVYRQVYESPACFGQEQ
uniref:MAGE family member B6 n=1 Tax=Theropithecus gelada TaxID=9565 RepID=A0A8D2G203_THEGE